MLGQPPARGGAHTLDRDPINAKKILPNRVSSSGYPQIEEMRSGIRVALEKRQATDSQAIGRARDGCGLDIRVLGDTSEAQPYLPQGEVSRIRFGSSFEKAERSIDPAPKAFEALVEQLRQQIPQDLDGTSRWIAGGRQPNFEPYFSNTARGTETPNESAFNGVVNIGLLYRGNDSAFKKSLEQGLDVGNRRATDSDHDGWRRTDIISTEGLLDVCGQSQIPAGDDYRSFGSEKPGFRPHHRCSVRQRLRNDQEYSPIREAPLVKSLCTKWRHNHQAERDNAEETL